jgi:hypothetical protein
MNAMPDQLSEAAYNVLDLLLSRGFPTPRRHFEDELLLVLLLALKTPGGHQIHQCAAGIREAVSAAWEKRPLKSSDRKPVPLISKRHFARLGKRIEKFKAAIDEYGSALPRESAEETARPSPNYFIEFESLSGRVERVEPTGLLLGRLKRDRPAGDRCGSSAHGATERFWFASPAGADVGQCLILTEDDRWIVFRPKDDFRERLEIQVPVTGFANRELSAGEAAQWLDRNAHILPHRLRGRVLSSAKDLGGTASPSEPACPVAEPHEFAGPEALDQPLDKGRIAHALLKEGHSLAAAFVRHFQERRSSTWHELVDAICPGDDRDWNTVKTWVNRVNNALIELKPPSRLRFRTTTRDHLVYEQLSRR